MFVTNNNSKQRGMAVKLDPLPGTTGGLIPFSDYSRWERRPIRRSEPAVRPKASLVQWSVSVKQGQGGPPAISQQQNHAVARGQGDKVKLPSSTSLNKPRISIRSLEPAKIKVLKVSFG